MDRSKLERCVAEAAIAMHFTAPTRARHLQQLERASEQLATALEETGVTVGLDAGSFHYDTDNTEIVLYTLEMSGKSDSDLPKSARQLETTCRNAGVAMDSATYDATGQTYHFKITVRGDGTVLRTRRLGDEGGTIDESAVPAEVASKLEKEPMTTHLKQAAGIVRSGAVRSVRISKANRFRSGRSKPKPRLKVRDTDTDSGGSSVGKWLSWLIGSREKSDADVVFDAYKDDHDCFVY